MRQPSFGKMFGFNGLKGLSDYVAGGGLMTDYVYRMPTLPLWVVPAGTSTGSPADRSLGRFGVERCELV